MFEINKNKNRGQQIKYLSSSGDQSNMQKTFFLNGGKTSIQPDILDKRIHIYTKFLSRAVFIGVWIKYFVLSLGEVCLF